MPHYYGDALRWWDGTAWVPAIPAVSAVNLVKVAAASVATSTSLAVTPTTINNGQTVTLTATVTGAATGSVQFTSNSGTPALNTTDATSPWTTTYSPTATAVVKAAYLANGSNLGSTSPTKTITVRQKSTKSYSQSTRSSYQWRQSSAPTKLESTFTVGASGNIPYTSFTVTGIKLQMATYFGSSGSTIITAHIANSTGTILSQLASVSIGAATSSDTPLSGIIDIPDVTLVSGTYRIGFTRSTSYQSQWDTYTGYGTLYEDGVSQGAGSLLWQIDGYVWV